MKLIEAVNYDGMSRKAANILSAQLILFPGPLRWEFTAS